MNKNYTAASYRVRADANARPPKKYLLKRLWKYLCSFKSLLISAALLTVISNALSLVGPKLSGFAIDAIEPGAGKVDFKTVFFYAGMMIIFHLIASVMSYILAILMIKLSRGVVYRMRRDLFTKLTALPVGFFDKHQTGDIISIISYDIDTINASLSTDLLQIATSVITVGGSLAMMLMINVPLVLVFAVTIPISVLFTRYMSKRVRPLFHNRSLKLGELNGYTEESIGGQKTSKAYHREEYMTGRYDLHNKEAADAYYKADYYGSVTGPSVNFINNLSLALVSVFGALLYLAGSMSLGDISSFVLYSRKFSGPINEFANIIAELQSAFAAAERVFRLIDELPEPPDAIGAPELNDIKGDVSFEHVRFGYDSDRIIINDLNLDIKSGSVTAIVGPTGAGKTTIINLLMRFYDVSGGSIKIDGRDIRSVTRHSLRSAFSMVLQDTWLFGGTIYDNIAYARGGSVTREEVENAARAAKIHGYIKRLPEGYDTVLSDNGVNISKGQKQLLTIARAMLVDSKMLILDEATSNVDTQTERRIQQAMLNLMRSKTCFVIAHRLSTIRSADLILVVRDGNVVEMGNHNSLMSAGGFYSEMYRSQFE